MQAVILAAGQGQRIRAHHELPKGFIQIETETIIQRSLSTLKQQGISDILLVIGYSPDYYTTLSKETGLFKTIYNPEFATFQSLYSLYMSRDWVHEDILLLESDLIYEPRAISSLLESTLESAVLLSGQTNSGDEVYVETDARGCLVNMAKNRDTLNAAQTTGELVGITKLSFAHYKQLMSLVDNDQTLRQDGAYEMDGLVRMAQQQPLPCLKIDDLLWGEIDNIDQYHRAQIISEKMQSAEAAHVE